MTSPLPPSDGSSPSNDSPISGDLPSNTSLGHNLLSPNLLSPNLLSPNLLSPKSLNPKSPSPLQSLTGALMAAAIGLLLYRLTTSIMQSFAAHPTVSHNTIVVNLSAAIRTLVVGLATMATGIFAFVTLGLVALAIQAVVQSLRNPKPES
jgi:Protein of unknown function (DUF3082)